MHREPKPMREIHQIQERIFEKGKNLSSGQRIRKIRKETSAIIRKYGLKIKTSSKI
jgi:hypothetical protein